jgi:hypothetical protein
MRTVTWNNVIGVFVPAREGCRAVLEPEMTFGLFPAVTAQAGSLEDGLDIAIENNLYSGGRRQCHGVGFRRPEREAQGEKNRHETARKTGKAPGNGKAV